VRILLHASVVGPTSISSPPSAGDPDYRKALRGTSRRDLGARFADLGERTARRRAVVGTGSAQHHGELVIENRNEFEIRRPPAAG